MVADLNIVDTPDTKILRLDEAGNGGAHHEYAVVDGATGKNLLAGINFQNGPVKEVGVNGCQHEDLIKIIIDRLECFQAGEYACSMNHLTLAMLHEALGCMEERTRLRRERGVEGTMEV